MAEVTRTALIPTVIQENISLDGIEYSSKSISEMPAYCAKLAMVLDDQPFYNDYGNHEKNRKIIHLKNEDEIRICEMVNECAATILGSEEKWYISSLASTPHISESERDVNIDRLVLKIKKGDTKCSIDTLKKSYEQVFTSLKNDWVREDVKNYPAMIFKYDSNEFSLYIKEKPMKKEADLLFHLARKLLVDNDVKSSDLWSSSQGAYQHGQLYVWVRKSAIDTVMKTLEFNFK